MIDLKFDCVSKRYRINQEPKRDATWHPLVRKLQSLRKRSQDFWALRDMSFEVQRGEAVGIIGPNGAGKSTILKLLSNITTPTSGEITINGRLSALIEIGSGFHPELTGSENVYLSGSILGMGRREITKKLDSIVDFAGVRQFIDMPVKRYSSGMYVRLGFSIAAHLQPDILLLDEVLAVGDAAFQAKCFQRIAKLKEEERTIIFISHDLGAVELLCDRVMLINRGEILADGWPRDVIIEYQRAYGAATTALPEAKTDGSLSALDIAALTLHDCDGHEVAVFHTGAPLTIHIDYAARDYVGDAVFEVFFYSEGGRFHCQYTTALSGGRIDLEPGTGVVEFSCAELGLQPDIYYVDVTVKHRGASDAEVLDWQYRCATFRVDPGKEVLGRFYMPHEWRITQHSDSVMRTPSYDSASLQSVWEE